MKEKRDFAGAIFLILLGVVFLLNTTGVIDWGIWIHILNYWPVMIILWGLGLVIGESLIARIIMAVVSFFAYSAVILLAYISYTQERIPFFPDYLNNRILKTYNHIDDGKVIEFESKIEEKDVENVTTRDIEIKVGASKFTIKDDRNDDKYFNAKSKFSEQYIEPQLGYSVKNGELDISFITKTKNNMFRFGQTTISEFDITVGKHTLPTNLLIDLGAGDGDIDLSNIALNDISVNVGAGNLDFTLSNKAIPTKIDIDMGASNVNITIPKSVGYSINYTLGVGEIMENEKSIASFISKESTYKSSNYDSSEKKIEVIASVGAGSLNIFTK